MLETNCWEGCWICYLSKAKYLSFVCLFPTQFAQEHYFVSLKWHYKITTEYSMSHLCMNIDFFFLLESQFRPLFLFCYFRNNFAFSVIFAFVRLWTNRVKLLLKKPPRYSIALHSISHIHTHTHTLHSISFSLSHTRSFVRWLHL